MIDISYSLAGAFTGLVVGLTGVGGSALMTPILLLFFGVSPITAIATDLWFAVITKIIGLPFVYSFLGSVNLFNGRIDGQTVRVGEDILHLGAPQSLPQGADVVAFARPHELEIVTDTQTTAGVGAKVSHVLSFGVTARVELDGMHTSAGQHFEVEMTRERLAELALQEGQLVRLHPSHLKVFGAQEKEAA